LAHALIITDDFFDYVKAEHSFFMAFSMYKVLTHSDGEGELASDIPVIIIAS